MIKDLEPPTLSLYTQGSNHTNHPYYYQNVNMTFTTSDVIGGVGLNDIRLYVNNGSSPLTNWGACINVSDTKTQTASNNYSFIIESVHLSAREDLYWLCTSVDNNGNMRNLSGSFEVFDDRIPYIIFHSIIPGIQVNHSDNAIINFEIREPMGGAGFNIDGSSLQVYYKKNSVPNNPTDGTQIFLCPNYIPLWWNLSSRHSRISFCLFGYYLFLGKCIRYKRQLKQYFSGISNIYRSRSSCPNYYN
jgi:hypothetical protein